jgi:hypothetical protein
MWSQSNAQTGFIISTLNTSALTPSLDSHWSDTYTNKKDR